MLRNIQRPWSLSSMVRFGIFAPSKEPRQKASPSPKYYSRPDEVPMSVFIQVLTSNNLQLLTLQGEPSSEQLSAAWEAMVDVYLDNTFSDEDRYTLKLIETETLLDFQITKAEAILTYLEYRYDGEMIEMLRRMGGTGEGYPKAGTLNAKKVWASRVRANIKRWKHTLLQTQQELKTLVKTDSGDTGKVSLSQFFEDLFARLAQHYHFHMDEKVITLSRFLAYYRDYKQYLLTKKKAVQ